MLRDPIRRSDPHTIVADAVLQRAEDGSDWIRLPARIDFAALANGLGRWTREAELGTALVTWTDYRSGNDATRALPPR